MHQQPRALDVPQELRAEASAFVGALDQAGDVGDHEADFLVRVAHRDHAEIRLKSGEGIIGNLRTRRRNARDQRGLADVGIADQADIREQLQFEAEGALFAGTSVFVLARRLVSRGGEAGVAAAAASAVGDDDALVGREKS